MIPRSSSTLNPGFLISISLAITIRCYCVNLLLNKRTRVYLINDRKEPCDLRLMSWLQLKLVYEVITLCRAQKCKFVDVMAIT